MPSNRSHHAAAGQWRDGQVDIGALHLEAGGLLPDVRISYEAWGTLNARASNAILIEHALTGDSHVVGGPTARHPMSGWWDGLIGPGRWIDTDEWFVVASNVLGGCQGSTGPASVAPDGAPWGSRFPFITVRDQVAAEATLADRLGIATWACVLGGSMGGMRSLEWALTHPERVRTAVVLASTPYATAEQIAWCRPQLLAIRSDPNFYGGDYYAHGVRPDAGLGLARRIAHVTYRSEHELAERFGRSAQGLERPFAGGRYAVESYLDHHADKLVGRFDANSYLVLTEAMSSHDIGRDRGGIAAALRRFPGRLVIGAVDSDRLYPPCLSELMARERERGYSERTRYDEAVTTVHSEYGHDGFLIETAQVGQLLRRALRNPRVQHSCA